MKQFCVEHMTWHDHEAKKEFFCTPVVTTGWVPEALGWSARRPPSEARYSRRNSAADKARSLIWLFLAFFTSVSNIDYIRRGVAWPILPINSITNCCVCCNNLQKQRNAQHWTNISAPRCIADSKEKARIWLQGLQLDHQMIATPLNPFLSVRVFAVCVCVCVCVFPLHVHSNLWKPQKSVHTSESAILKGKDFVETLGVRAPPAQTKIPERHQTRYWSKKQWENIFVAFFLFLGKNQKGVKKNFVEPPTRQKESRINPSPSWHRLGLKLGRTLSASSAESVVWTCVQVETIPT